MIGALLRMSKKHRRATALMIVVMLLILLAIIGTAFISTSQTDRVSAIQNNENTQIDLHVDGVVNIVKSMLLDDLFDSYSATTLEEKFRARNWADRTTAPSYGGDIWLAARVPEPSQPETYPSNAQTHPWHEFRWPYVSRMPHLETETGGGDIASGNSYFVNIFDAKWPSSQAGWALFPYIMNVDGIDYPTFPSYVDGNGKLRFSSGMDADGDGIADSGMWRLTKQPRNDLVYFAGVRIVDNNSAINVNTAWMRDFDLDSSGNRVPNRGYFPANVGLRELLTGTEADKELRALNYYRFGGRDDVDLRPQDENGVRTDFAYATQAEAFSSAMAFRMGNPALNGNTRFGQFTWLDDATLAYHFSLINPDIPPGPLEQVFLSAVGGLRTGQQDSLYKAAPNFLPNYFDTWKEFARLKDASGRVRETEQNFMRRWLRNNFDHDNGRYNVRPLLVAHNPISLFAPYATEDLNGDGQSWEPGNPGMMGYRTFGGWNPAMTYNLHDMVRRGEHYYVSMRSNNRDMPPTTPTSNASWDYQPWDSLPMKTSINMATFRELWRTYWNGIMLGDSSAPGESAFSRSVLRYSKPVVDEESDPEGDDEDKNDPLKPPPNKVEVEDPLGDDPEAGFLASIPIGTPLPVGPHTGSSANIGRRHQAVLRSALAAVNTMGMRDHSDNVISRTITLYDDQMPIKVNKDKPGIETEDQNPNVLTRPRYRVNVFSNERQPVISKMVIQTSPDGQGYVAIELYNPYPEPIQLRNWHIALAKRETLPNETDEAKKKEEKKWKLNYGKLTFTDVTELSQHVSEIRSEEFIVFESGKDKRPANVEVDNEDRSFELPKLAEAFGQEIYVLRPRRADGTLTRSNHEVNWYDEGAGSAANLHHLVPIDNMDLGGLEANIYTRRDLIMDNESTTQQYGFQYVHIRDTSEQEGWRCFYPGAYSEGTGSRQLALTKEYFVQRMIEEGYLSENDAKKTGIEEWIKFVQEKMKEKDFENFVTNERVLRHSGFSIKMKPDPGDKKDQVFLGTRSSRWVAPESTDTSELTNFPTYKPAHVKLHAPNWPGENAVHNGVNQYPYGMFARVGDVMRVPFIGAYTVWQTKSTGELREPNESQVCELNSITMDSALWGNTRFLGRAAPSTLYGEGWKNQMVDYFTVRSPLDDMTPNVHPDLYGYWDQDGNWNSAPRPNAVANTDPKRANAREPYCGQQGLINVNTAPAIVLEQLPLITNPDGSINKALTKEASQQIARSYSRFGGNEPKMTGILGTYYHYYKLTGTWEYQVDDPKKPGEKMTVPEEDFEVAFEPINRISNLITTRSDTFTCYVIVEGWRDPFTYQAKRVLQRRVAFLVDRSQVTPTNLELKVTNIPND